MRKLWLALATTVLVVAGPTPLSRADDPGPIVIIDPPPLSPGVDAMIRPGDRSEPFVGADERGSGQRLDQHITQFQRAIAIVRICNLTDPQRIRLHGTGSGPNWRIRYFVRSHEVSRGISSGSYHTRRLGGGGCMRVKVTVRLRFGAADPAKTVKVRAIPRTGAGDAVSTKVHVDGPFVVP